MKKRILCLILALFTLILLPSCGKQDKVQRALDKTKELENTNADITLTISTKEANPKVKAIRKINLRADKNNGDGEIYCISTHFDGKTDKIFLSSSKVYVPTPNNTGYQMSQEDYFKGEQNMLSFYNESVKELPKDIIDIASAKKDGNNTVLTAYPSKEYFQENFPQQSQAIFNCFEEQLGLTNVTIDSCFLSVTVRGGYLKEMYFFCDVTVKYTGSEEKYTVKSSIVINDPGTDVELRLPVSCDKYEKK